MRRLRSALNIVAGTALGLFVMAEYLAGSGCSWQVSTISVEAVGGTSAESCLRNSLRRRRGTAGLSVAPQGALAVRVRVPGGNWSSAHESVVEAVTIAQDMLRACPSVEPGRLRIEPASGHRFLGFVQSPI